MVILVLAGLEAEAGKAGLEESCSTTASRSPSNPDGSRDAEGSSFLPAVVKSLRCEVVK